MLNEIIVQVLLPIIGVIASALVPILLKYLVSWLKAKTDNEKLQGALDQLNDIVYTTVMDLEQTVRKALSDGKLTDSEKAQIKSLAMSKVQTQLPKFIADQVKIGVKDLEAYISSKIEMMVGQMNQGK